MARIVAIDGPAGAGKSTVAKQLAQRLGYRRVETGSIYRAITWAALEAGLTSEDEICSLFVDFDLQIDNGRTLLRGQDVTGELRSQRIASEVSRVAAMPQVRKNLLGVQRDLARSDPLGSVLEGRDIGTVVFPDADLKFFLTASLEERALRRFRELPEGSETLESVRKRIRDRDAWDSARDVAPLRPADDAINLDSTGCAIVEVVDKMYAFAVQRALVS